MDELARQLANLAGNSPLNLIEAPFPEPVAIRLFLKRDDLLHPKVSGNKWRKLKYNLLAARVQKLETLLTFGGAYSNHLYATAAAGQIFGFRTIGVVRGDELGGKPLNSTLAFCRACGMQLYFVNRNDYRRKEDADFLDELRTRFGAFYLIPEGGTNELAIQGTAEIMPEIIQQLGHTPNFVCCPVGTGGTVAGLLKSAPNETGVLGFLVLKVPDSLWLSDLFPPTARGHRVSDYHFGGYARTTPELLNFIRTFEQRTGILLEQVYTGKMLFGVYDLARKGYFPEGASVVVVHTGGLQGRSGELDIG
ncbi:1-aminocyclopropane-1-carboxylate deaminase/D-cysteine desulfhydrase [Spirosoma pulveris]